MSKKFAELLTASIGVKQSDVLSPWLFSICIDNISVEVMQFGLGCHVEPRFFGIHFV